MAKIIKPVITATITDRINRKGIQTTNPVKNKINLMKQTIIASKRLRVQVIF
jgi:hypothetical protein